MIQAIQKSHNKIRGNTILTAICVKGCPINTPELSIFFDFSKEKKFNRLQKQAIKKMKNYIDILIENQKCDIASDDTLNNQIIEKNNQTFLQKIDENTNKNSLLGKRQDICEEYEYMTNGLNNENQEKQKKSELETIEIREIPNENNFINANIDELNDNFIFSLQRDWDDSEFDEAYSDFLSFSF